VIILTATTLSRKLNNGMVESRCSDFSDRFLRGTGRTLIYPPK